MMKIGLKNKRPLVSQVILNFYQNHHSISAWINPYLCKLTDKYRGKVTNDDNIHINTFEFISHKLPDKC